MPQWSIVVPAKRLVVAKTRLRPLTAALGAERARRLVLALLADTVAAAVACPAVGEVLVVTDDPAAADVVRPFGARTLADEPDRGLNPALETAPATLPARRRGASSDLPALRPRRARGRAPAAASAPRCFVPDALGTGTTLLTALGTRSCPGSGRLRAAHQDGGAIPLTGDWPGLVRDVDTAADLRAALALGAGARTARSPEARPRPAPR